MMKRSTAFNTSFGNLMRNNREALISKAAAVCRQYQLRVRSN